MTTLDVPYALPDEEHARRTWWQRVEALLERGSEWLNPILVKEARQALKSQHFVITFGFVLFLAWIWTVIGIFWSLPGIFYGAEGKGMLYGYFLVSSLALIIVVPFATYRSLAAEREDGTYELISITALNARQIVAGKLGSAVLQMMVFFSALAPCVAFTYLLRGVDIFSIFFVLYYTFLMSLLLSTLGLLVATATRARHWQVLLSVLLLLLLFITAILWCWFIWGSLYEDIWAHADSWEFWIWNGFVGTMYASFLLLFLWAAASQISFASDNRSTRLRYVMAAQQVIWFAWLAYFWLAEREPAISVIIVSFAAVYWILMGALMIGEYPQLSPRVKRDLPQSLIGRMFLTWFVPGSGSGYMFAVQNLTALVVVCLAMMELTDLFDPGRNRQRYSESIWFLILTVGYVDAYLGLTRFVVVLVRQKASVGIVFSLLVTLFFGVAGAVGPWLFQFWLFDYRNDDYTELQMTNWFWTLMETMNNRIESHPLSIIGILGTAVLMRGLNLLLCGREVSQVRIQAPRRVQEEEAAKLPAFKPKRGPWDDDEDEPLEAVLPPGA